MVRRGRKWSLGNWRGGLARSTVWDEESNPPELACIAQTNGALWVVQARAEAPFVDPELTDQLVARAMEWRPSPPVMYGSIPPGLAGWVFRADFLAELAEKEVWPGSITSYKAWEPTIDLTEQLFTFKVPIEIARTSARFLVDSTSAFTSLGPLADRLDRLDARAACRWVNALEPLPAPAELDIEITTRRRSEHRFYPAATRPDMPLERFRRILDECARANDILRVKLTGHGDPLEHPDLPQFLAALAQSGVYGSALLTDALALSPDRWPMLLASSLDVLQIALDGYDRQSFALVHRTDNFETASGQIDGFLEARRRGGQTHPLVVVSMARSRATESGLSDFYDTWSTKADGALITGRSDYAGQWPVDDLPVLEPPAREPCRRLARRLSVLADGNVVRCLEDFQGRSAMGHVDETPAIALWNGPFRQLWQSHRQERWNELALCATCREWHRP